MTQQIQHKSHQICMSTLVACLLIVLSSSELLRSSKHSACRQNALVIAKLYEVGVLPECYCNHRSTVAMIYYRSIGRYFTYGCPVLKLNTIKKKVASVRDCFIRVSQSFQ